MIMMEHKNGFHLPLRLTIEPSKRLKWSFLLIHLASILPIWKTGLSMLTSCSIFLLVMFHYALLNHFYINRRYSLILKSGMRWMIDSGRHGFQSAELISGGLILPWLTVLRFRQSSGMISIVITTDNVNLELFRRLRVFLRFPPTD